MIYRILMLSGNREISNGNMKQNNKIRKGNNEESTNNDVSLFVVGGVHIESRTDQMSPFVNKENNYNVPIL